MTQNIPKHLQRQMEMTPKNSSSEPKVDNRQSTSDIVKKRRRLKYAKRWALFNRLIELDQRSLKDAEFRVLITLFRHQRNGVADISQVELARQVGKTRESVSRAIQELVKKGLVVVVYHGGQPRKGIRATNKYCVL